MFAHFDAFAPEKVLNADVMKLADAGVLLEDLLQAGDDFDGYGHFLALRENAGEAFSTG